MAALMAVKSVLRKKFAQFSFFNKNLGHSLNFVRSKHDRSLSVKSILCDHPVGSKVIVKVCLIELSIYNQYN